MAGRPPTQQRRVSESLYRPHAVAHTSDIDYEVGSQLAAQPMNVNFGLFPDLELRDQRGRPFKGRARKVKLSERARIDLRQWLNEPTDAAA